MVGFSGRWFLHLGRNVVRLIEGVNGIFKIKEYLLGKNSSEEKLLTLYATYIDASVLVSLKDDATERTKNLMLTNTELHTLYVGYRQLKAEELNKYDESHPPPVPYPFMDQINVTTTVAASMPSCLHFSPGVADGWDTSGCKVAQIICLIHGNDASI